MDMAANDSGSPAAVSLPAEMQDKVLRRLRLLEGQVRGVQRMVREERDCQEVLHQIAAIKAAAHSLGMVVLEHYVWACLRRQAEDISEVSRSRVQDALQQLFR